MAYVCQICGKGRMAGHNVSHAKNRTPKYTVPNLHRVSISRGEGSIRVCTNCLRRMRQAVKPQTEGVPA